MGVWKRIAVGVAASLAVAACSGDQGSGEVEDTAAEHADPEAEPELHDPSQRDTQGQEPTPDQAEPEVDEPEPEPGSALEPEQETPTAEEPDGYDGFPIDQPLEDVSLIDEAYVNEILRVLDENHANLVMRMRELGIEESSPDAMASVQPELAMTTIEQLEGSLFERIVEFESEGWIQEDLEPARSEVIELLTVEQGCVSAVIVMDAEPFYDPRLNGRWLVGLQPRDELVQEARSVWRFLSFGPFTGEIVDHCDAP